MLYLILNGRQSSLTHIPLLILNRELQCTPFHQSKVLILLKIRLQHRRMQHSSTSSLVLRQRSVILIFLVRWHKKLRVNHIPLRLLSSLDQIFLRNICRQTFILGLLIVLVVSFLVWEYVWLLSKPGSASRIGTGVRLLSCVDSKMGRQVEL